MRAAVTASDFPRSPRGALQVVRGGSRRESEDLSIYHHRPLSTSMEGRAYRKQNVDRAYDVQTRAGLEGAARFTSLGVGLAILAHYTWPTFRCVRERLSLLLPC